MRPSLLDPLFAPLTALPGVGDKVAALIENVVSADLTDRHARVGDLVFTLPYQVIDRTNRPGIAGAAQGVIVTLEVRIDRHQPPPRGRPNVPYRVFAHDETGEIALTFFRAHAAHLAKLMPEGEMVLVSGRMEWFNGRPSMVHPDHITPVEGDGAMPLVEPVYAMTQGLSAKVLRRAIANALERVPALPEWIEPDVLETRSFPTMRQALLQLHAPENPGDISPETVAWRRLAYDEFLAGQIAIGLLRGKVRRAAGRPLIGDGRLKDKILAALPYALTGSQQAAVAEIETDLGKPERMLRLLQGDVGSGKTVVALMAMTRAVEAGYQAALMAPTEVLARQHFATLAPITERAGMTIAVLTGREKGRERSAVLEGLASGALNLVVGTHALFQEGVAFKDLALTVVDEQHRFGVHQRLAIGAKSEAPDMLVMTATPIPRTLVLTAFGDMDVSHLTEKPVGRQPIRTVVMPMERMDDLVARIRDAVHEGQKAYWICPLVEESEAVDITSAEERFAALKPVFGAALSLIHGRMKGADKDEAMRAFKAGETKVLIATTVIEVGVDVPDATIIVIEHAERFGLSQLHQLRGRVGRGSTPSSCVLLYKDPLGETAKKRLSVIRDTEDGFVIAEEDLKLRGQGDVLGTKQSGMPGFQLARIEVHADLLEVARRDARAILTEDPELKTPRGEAIQLLLYLFGRDEAVRLLRAG
ncbi:ATP-dependent DNA helicase RecG, partial [Salmonella enterica subsp. enterica]|nr:ATP-dependent DNA helicase RecG [Salmonella enterica subsp. enterica serovar Enteritidis]